MAANQRVFYSFDLVARARATVDGGWILIRSEGLGRQDACTGRVPIKRPLALFLMLTLLLLAPPAADQAADQLSCR